MSAKEVIEQYENLFAWEQKQVKQHIMGNIDIKETITDIVYDFQSVCSKIEDLDYNLIYQNIIFLMKWRRMSMYELTVTMMDGE